MHEWVSDPSLAADTFPLTPACLGQMLGMGRTSVIVAAGTLTHAGLLRYHRGLMTLVDRAGLEDFTCECYGVVRAAFAAV